MLCREEREREEHDDKVTRGEAADVLLECFAEGTIYTYDPTRI
jgi:hypothetical protein